MAAQLLRISSDTYLFDLYQKVENRLVRREFLDNLMTQIASSTRDWHKSQLPPRKLSRRADWSVAIRTPDDAPTQSLFSGWLSVHNACVAMWIRNVLATCMLYGTYRRGFQSFFFPHQAREKASQQRILVWLYARRMMRHRNRYVLADSTTSLRIVDEAWGNMPCILPRTLDDAPTQSLLLSDSMAAMWTVRFQSVSFYDSKKTVTFENIVPRDGVSKMSCVFGIAFSASSAFRVIQFLGA
jgi:hypothetical protein